MSASSIFPLAHSLRTLLQDNRKICVVTGSRADYGHLFWLLREIDEDPALELQLIVTGMHLDEAFGATHKVIEEDGFAIDARVDLAQKDDTRPEITRAMGRGMIGFADALAALKPDIVVVLGDRFEIFIAAAAALMANIPIAHLQGGEITEGALDDSLRHAITKMAHVHFAATRIYAKRIVQMGETPELVFATGTPGLDNIDRLELPDMPVLERELGITLGKAFFLVTYHPETIGQKDAAKTAGDLIRALDEFSTHTVLITGVNADPDHLTIKKCFDDFATRRPERIHLRSSLGIRLYLAAMKHCACVIGNSSSGIIEAPALNVPTVNIGDRQKGRLRAQSIIDCVPTYTAIRGAMERALTPEFRRTFDAMEPPYGTGGASKRIKDRLKDLDLSDIQHKIYYDIEPGKTALCGS